MKTPIGVVSRGVIAGLAGTAAMDAYWYTRALTEGRRDNVLRWEFGAEQSWDKVGAPAQMGHLMFERLTRRPLDARWAPLTNNVMHWGYGVSWAVLYGVAAAALRRRCVLSGLPFGAAVWATSYVVLPLAKLYRPIWQYDAKTLAVDLGAHLAYGAATAAAFTALG